MPSTLYKHSGNRLLGSHAGTSRTTGPSGRRPSGNARRRVTGLVGPGETPLILMKTGQSSVSVALGRRHDQSRPHSSFPNELPGVTRHRAAPHRSAR